MFLRPLIASIIIAVIGIVLVTRRSWICRSAGCISILSALALARFAFQVPELMALQACRGNLSSVGFALSTYFQDYKLMPPSLRELTERGLLHENSVRSVFANPALTGSDYCYVVSLTQPPPDAWPIAFELPDVHEAGRRCVYYGSGETRTLRAEEFAAEMAAFISEYETLYEQKPRFLSDRPDPVVVRLLSAD